MKQIKIVSEGTGFTTKVLGPDGEPLPGCSKAVITILPSEMVQAVLTFDNVSLEIAGYADFDYPKDDGTPV